MRKALAWLRVPALVFALALPTAGLAAAPEPPDPWPDLKRDVFNDRPIQEDTGVVALEMPYRAEDGAFVPTTLRLNVPPADSRSIKTVTLVIDQNPAPVAATFTLAPGVTMITTKVRVDSYSNVRAVAELSDGTLHMAKIFVKASGGCSAPAAGNLEAARANLGRMQLKQVARGEAAAASRPREAEIAIRHPNNSGLQMDQVTRHYTPAFFVRELNLWQGDEPVLKVDAGISLSEDPTIRFVYRPNGATSIRAEAVDTDGNRFSGAWKVEAEGM